MTDVIDADTRKEFIDFLRSETCCHVYKILFYILLILVIISILLHIYFFISNKFKNNPK